jgi:hypothetical protein
VEPTEEPTLEPTEEPTVEPTEEPTPEPPEVIVITIEEITITIIEGSVEIDCGDFTVVVPVRWVIIETVIRTITFVDGEVVSEEEETTIEVYEEIDGDCPDPSTIVELLSFTAEAAAHVTLAWETGTEVDNAGFNLWRGEVADGPYTQLNDALIPAEGDAVSGASYTYTDTDVVKGVTYYYKLEDMDIHGVSTFHGPVSATPSPIGSIYLPLIVK